MAKRRERTAFRRSVAARVLVSYALVTLAFALAAGFSVLAQRAAAREMQAVQTCSDGPRRTCAGYLPIALAVRDLVAKQDIWNAQLNHVTDAKNPADLRVWFDASLRVGRPRGFDEVREKITRAFVVDRDSESRLIGATLITTTREIERFAAGDADRLEKLFHALDRNDASAAQHLRDELVTRGTQVSTRLGRLNDGVQKHVEQQLDAAQERELLAIWLLAVLSAITVLVGVLMALYARRVIRPLGRVTERAQAVARGDLEARPVVQSDDEIGELAATFEQMVSAIAQANAQLVVAERLATVGKMAAHVTHEIRNPLSSIALNLELLEEQLGLLRGGALTGTVSERRDVEAEAQTLLRAIGREVERLSGLSQQYLAFARQRPLDLEPEDLGAIVREGADFVRRELEQHGVELELEIANELPTVLADEGQLRQALLNLIRNAREAMQKGGRITVRVERADDGGVALMVDDEGPGIEPALRQHLFEPFFTTKTHGTGLGLAITQQIAKAHGGSISCESRSPEPGTRFVLRLPGARPSPARARSTPENAAE
jgi:two-component system NtrC family sensor kinase